MSFHFVVKVERPGLPSCPLVGDHTRSQEFAEGSTGSVQMLLAEGPMCCAIECGVGPQVWEILVIQSFSRSALNTRPLE